jgi:hypothetical protein
MEVPLGKWEFVQMHKFSFSLFLYVKFFN